MTSSTKGRKGRQQEITDEEGGNRKEPRDEVDVILFSLSLTLYYIGV